MWTRMAVVPLLAAVLGCPGNPAEPDATSEHPGLAVVTLTGSLSRTDTLRAYLMPFTGVGLPADTVVSLDVFMGPRSGLLEARLLLVSLQIRPPTRHATGTFPLEHEGSAFVMDTLPESPFDPDVPDRILSSTGGEVEILTNRDSVLVGRFAFDAADGTGRMIRATGTFDARLLTFDTLPPIGRRGS